MKKKRAHNKANPKQNTRPQPKRSSSILQFPPVEGEPELNLAALFNSMDAIYRDPVEVEINEFTRWAVREKHLNEEQAWKMALLALMPSCLTEAGLEYDAAQVRKSLSAAEKERFSRAMERLVPELKDRPIRPFYLHLAEDWMENRLSNEEFETLSWALSHLGNLVSILEIDLAELIALVPNFEKALADKDMSALRKVLPDALGLGISDPVSEEIVRLYKSRQKA